MKPIDKNFSFAAPGFKPNFASVPEEKKQEVKPPLYAMDAFLPKQEPNLVPNTKIIKNIASKKSEMMQEVEFIRPDFEMPESEVFEKQRVSTKITD